MTAELHFHHVIRTLLWVPPPFPREIVTVEQAIDCVQELPPVMLQLGRWRPAFSALWEALDFPQDGERLAAAEAALRAALSAEGWLDEAPPA